jgi:hypothetical protein
MRKPLDGIDKECAWDCKKNSEGNVSFWKGCKLHLDVSDTGFPLTAIVTGANVHDGQLAIPMEQITERKVFFVTALWTTPMIRQLLTTISGAAAAYQ